MVTDKIISLNYCKDHFFPLQANTGLQDLTGLSLVSRCGLLGGVDVLFFL